MKAIDVQVGKRVISRNLYRPDYYLRSGTVVKAEFGTSDNWMLTTVQWDDGATTWPSNHQIEEHP